MLLQVERHIQYIYNMFSTEDPVKLRGLDPYPCSKNEPDVVCTKARLLVVICHDVKSVLVSFHPLGLLSVLLPVS